MIINRWVTPLLGLILIISMGQTSLVQGQFPPGNPYQQAVQQTMPPDVFGQQGYNPANNSAIDTSGFQSWMKPWPAISPFENVFSETFWEDGIWNRIQIPMGAGSRRYYGDMSILQARFRKPNRARIGATGVRTLAQSFPAITAANLPNFQVASARVFDSGRFNVNGADPQMVLEDHQNKKSPGIRATLGFTDVDQGGAEWSFFVLTGDERLFKRGSEDPSNRTANAALSVNDVSGGITIPFDILYRVHFQSRAAGTEFNLLNRPLYKSKNVHVRSTWGMRYLYLGEKFQFNGKYSGDIATFNPDGSLNVITTPNPAGFIQDVSVLSRVNSHMIGPQGGFEYAVGGESFTLGGHTKVGVMLNVEQMKLESSGLDVPFFVDDGAATTTINPNYNPNLKSTDSQNTAHFSPLFEQKIYADMKVLHLIPGLRSMKIFDNAKLRLGYSITAAWEVSRPNENIVWQAGQIQPVIRARRNLWYTDNWSASISWER